MSRPRASPAAAECRGTPVRMDRLGPTSALDRAAPEGTPFSSTCPSAARMGACPRHDHLDRRLSTTNGEPRRDLEGEGAPPAAAPPAPAAPERASFVSTPATRPGTRDTRVDNPAGRRLAGRACPASARACRISDARQPHPLLQDPKDPGPAGAVRNTRSPSGSVAPAESSFLDRASTWVIHPKAERPTRRYSRANQRPGSSVLDRDSAELGTMGTSSLTGSGACTQTPFDRVTLTSGRISTSPTSQPSPKPDPLPAHQGARESAKTRRQAACRHEQTHDGQRALWAGRPTRRSNQRP